jgi:alpha-L-arabinofuranosidase
MIATLSNPDIHAYNSFQQRDVVVPRTSELKIGDSALVVTFPPASVTTLQIELG